jgi:hypothetical protein
MSGKEQDTFKPDFVQNTSSISGENEPASSSQLLDAGNNLTFEETRDGFILAFNVVKDISEASGILSPLKSTCALLIRGLEITRVSTEFPILSVGLISAQEINNNKKSWRRLTNELNEQLSGLKGYIDQLDESSSPSPSLKYHLGQYAEYASFRVN